MLVAVGVLVGSGVFVGVDVAVLVGVEVEPRVAVGRGVLAQVTGVLILPGMVALPVNVTGISVRRPKRMACL